MESLYSDLSQLQKTVQVSIPYEREGAWKEMKKRSPPHI